MSILLGYLPSINNVHWIFRHLNHWQSFLGSTLGFLGVAWSLRKNHSNSLLMEKSKRAHDRSGIRTALSEEISGIVRQSEAWIGSIIPKAKAEQKCVFPPARFKTPLYDTLKASIIHLTSDEIKAILSFQGQLNHMTREFIRIDLDEKSEARASVHRMNASSILEDDTFSIEIGRAGFFEKRLQAIKSDGERVNDLLRDCLKC